MASIKDLVRNFSIANIQRTANQLIQGKNYQSPDVLTDKTKLMARRANVGAIDAPRLQRNVQNLTPQLRQRIVRPTPQKLRVNQFNRAINSVPGRVGVGVLTGVRDLDPLKTYRRIGLGGASDAAINDQGLQNSLAFQGGKLGAGLVGNALMYGKAFQAAESLPVVGAKITSGLKGLDAAGGARAIAGKAIGAYAVGDPIIGGLRGGSDANLEGKNVLAGVGKGIAEELTFPVMAAASIPDAYRVMTDKNATPQQRVQAGLQAGLSVLALVPIIPGLSDAKMAKVIPDQYKKHMDVLRRADDTMKKAVPEKMYGKFFTDDTMKDPVKFLQGLNDTGSLKRAMQEMIGEGKLSVDDAVDLYKQLDIDLSKMEGVAPGGRFSGDIEALRTPVDATVGVKANAPIDTLLEEARKYKSAEEFADSILFHGTTKSRADKILGGEGLIASKGRVGANKGRGIRYVSATPDADAALGYASGRGEMAELVGIPKPKNIVNLGDVRVNGTLTKEGQDFVRQFGRQELDWGGKEVERYLKSQGYDAIQFMAPDGHIEVRIFDDVKNTIKLPEGFVKATDATFMGKPTKHFSIDKSQLTDIWNKANADSKIDPLIAEARKYKSAEEFVKAQGEPMYHGSNKYQAGQLRKGSIRGSRGSGVYLTPELDQAKRYGKINDVYVDKSARVFDWDKTSPEQVIKDIELFLNKNKIPYENRNGFITSTDGKISIDPWVKSKNMMTRFLGDVGHNKFFEDLGYDAAKFGEGERQFVVYNPDVIKTKSQLTDIWNQAQAAKRLEGTDKITPLLKKTRQEKIAMDMLKDKKIDVGEYNKIAEGVEGMRAIPLKPQGQSAQSPQVEQGRLDRGADLSASSQKLQSAPVAESQIAGLRGKSLEGKAQRQTGSLLQKSELEAQAIRLKNKSYRDVSSLSDIVRSDSNNVKNKVGALDYLRTPDRVLQKIGLSKEADVVRKSHNAYLDELPKEIDRVTAWYERVGKSDDASKRIFKYLDGQDVKLEGEELKVAGEMQKYLSDWADKLGLPVDRRIAHYITHIFEKDFIQKEFDQDIAKLITDKVPGSVYDPFLEQRLGKQGYVEDAFRALDAYVKRATRKYHMDPALEQLSRSAEKLDLESWQYVKSFADRVNLRPTALDNLVDNTIKQSPIGYQQGARPVTAISRKMRQAVYRGTLGLNVGSALRNLTQGANTYAQLGEKYTAVGYMGAARSFFNGSDELVETGVLRNSFIEDRSLSSTKKTWGVIDKGIFSLFEAAEKVNRGAAYFGAKAKALDNGLSEAEAKQAGVDMARKTQFTFGSVDTPVALQSDIVKLFTQFQSFNVKQTEFLAEMVKNKEYAGMVRWLGANLVMLGTIGQVMGWDWNDFVPFGGIIDGQSPIGSSPAITYAKDSLTLLTGGKDRYGQPMKPSKLLEDAIPLIPGGVQMKKTYQGIKSLKEGASTSSKGRVRFPVEQSMGNYVKGVFLGQNAFPEAREYFDNNRTVLGEKQSQTYKQLFETKGGSAAKAYYDSIIGERDANKDSSGRVESNMFGIGGIFEKGAKKTGIRAGGIDESLIESMFRDNPESLAAADIAKYYSRNLPKNPATAFAKAQYEKDVWGKVSDIQNRESLSNAQKRTASIKMLKKIGVPIEDLDYYSIAKEENALKSIFVRESLSGITSREQMFAQFIRMRKEVNGKQILTAGVIDDLVDEGLITKDEGKALKNLEFVNGKVVRPKMTGRGKKARLKKFSYKPLKVKTPKAPKLGRPVTSSTTRIPTIKQVTAPQVKMPTVSIPQQKYQVKFNL